MSEPSSRPRVFVSSTVRDFQDVRSALRYWLEEQGCDVVMSEYHDFDRAADAGTFDSCFEAVQTCQYYILLVGGRKGSEYQTGISVTQQEYRIAADLARRGHQMKVIPFVRASVETALAERAALREAGASEKTLAAPSPVLEDPSFVEAFVAEVRETEVQRQGTDTSVGKVWIYPFGDFRHLVDALKVTLNLHRPIHRQALLANLKFELEENIAALCPKHKGLPSPNFTWLSGLRREITLHAGQGLFAPVRLSTKRASWVDIFWFIGMTSPDRLHVMALHEAVSSGEFLEYDPDFGLRAGPVCKALRDLLSAIDSYRYIYPVVRARENEYAALHAAVLAKSLNITMLAHDLLMLFRIHDIMRDILRLSTALLTYALDPIRGMVPAVELSPPTPREDQIEELKAEQTTHEDVEGWMRDGFLRSQVAGDDSATPSEVRAAWDRSASMREMLNPVVKRLADELRRRAASDGPEAAISWVHSLSGEELRKLSGEE